MGFPNFSQVFSDAYNNALGGAGAVVQNLGQNAAQQSPAGILNQLQSSRRGGMQEGMDFLVQQGLGTVDPQTGQFTPNQFLGRLTPAAERAAMASREAGLTDIGATQGRAARQLRGIQAQSGVTGPAAGAQQMALLSQGQQARAQMERQLQEQQIGIEQADLERQANERLLGLSIPMQFGALGAQEGMGAQQLGLGYQGLNQANQFLQGLLNPPAPPPAVPQQGTPQVPGRPAASPRTSSSSNDFVSSERAKGTYDSPLYSKQAAYFERLRGGR